MKLSSKYLAAVISSVSLFTINFVFSQPAKASIICETGTTNHYQSGQIESCVISSEIRVQAANHITGTSSFTCEEKNYIYFQENGQFKSCVLSEAIEIRTGNAVEVCPEKSLVYVAGLNDSNNLLGCQRLSY